jgi:hypothetical protein
MKGIIKNWKTTLFGVGALITAIAQIVTGDKVNGIIAVCTALGLISAKDHDSKD